jgi:hypothetical protein
VPVALDWTRPWLCRRVVEASYKVATETSSWVRLRRGATCQVVAHRTVDAVGTARGARVQLWESIAAAHSSQLATLVNVLSGIRSYKVEMDAAVPARYPTLMTQHV